MGSSRSSTCAAQLDDAAANKSIRNVVVMAHHPIDDPSPTANSQLGDRKEAAHDRRSGWPTSGRRTGKGAAYMAAHAGTFAATRTDGVLLPLTGNSGKGPACGAGRRRLHRLGAGRDRPESRPARPVSGWSAPERAWLQVEFRPHVDTLELTAPATLRRGQTAPAAATVVQDGRRVPVAFPVSADWWGSLQLHIGPAADAPFWAVASYDPSTGQCSPASAPAPPNSGVTVNGVTKTTAPQGHLVVPLA